MFEWSEECYANNTTKLLSTKKWNAFYKPCKIYVPWSWASSEQRHGIVCNGEREWINGKSKM